MANVEMSPAEQLQLASRVSREVELLRIATTRVGAVLDGPLSALDALRTAEGGQIQLHSEQKNAFDAEQSTLTVELAFRVGVAPKDPGDTAVFHVEATFVLVYAVRAAPPEAERERAFDAFAAVNGTYNAWPFLREIVSSMAARLGGPPILLPLFRPEMMQAQGGQQK